MNIDAHRIAFPLFYINQKPTGDGAYHPSSGNCIIYSPVAQLVRALH